MSISTLHPVQPQSHNAGLSHGVAMTDEEVLRFYNGICAALSVTNRPRNTTRDPYIARSFMGHALDELGEQGMIAIIGYAGTPVIRPMAATNEMAAA
jgi:hypothetical protein